MALPTLTVTVAIIINISISFIMGYNSILKKVKLRLWLNRRNVVYCQYDRTLTHLIILSQKL